MKLSLLQTYEYRHMLRRWLIVILGLIIQGLLVAFLIASNGVQGQADVILAPSASDPTLCRVVSVAPFSEAWMLGVQAGALVSRQAPPPFPGAPPSTSSAQSCQTQEDLTLFQVVNPQQNGPPVVFGIYTAPVSVDTPNLVITVILAILFDIVGIFIFIRAEERATARIAYLLFLVFSLICCLMNTQGINRPILSALYIILALLSSGLATTFVCLFPYPTSAKPQTVTATPAGPPHGPLPPYFPLVAAFLLMLIGLPSFFLSPHIRPLIIVALFGYNVICLIIVISILLWGLQRMERYDRQFARMVAVGMVFFLFPLIFSLDIVRPGSIVHQSIVHLLPLPLIALPIICDYALFRHQLLGRKRLLNRQITRILLWILLASLFILPFIIVLRALEDTSSTNTTLRDYLLAALLAISLWLFPLLWNRVRDVGDHIFYHDFYQYNRALRDISTNVSRLQGWEQISAFVLPQLIQQLNASNALLAIRALTQDEWRDSLGQTVINARSWHLYQHAERTTITGERLCKVIEQALAHHTAAYEPLMIDDILLSALYEGDTISGFLCLEQKKNFEPYSRQDTSFLATLVAQLSVLEINNRYLTQAQYDAQRLTALNRRVMTTQENERRYLALELHDDVLQQAMLMVRQLSDASTMSDIADTMPLARSVVTNLRRTCLALRPTLLDELGLPEALRWLSHQQQQTNGQDTQITFTCFGTVTMRLPAEVELAFYRVAQEALNNTQKHAQASKIQIRLRYRPDGAISLIIADNGLGSSRSRSTTKAVASSELEHLGIMGMYERMGTIGGRLRIRSSPDHGFSVRATYRPQRPQEVAIMPSLFVAKNRQTALQ